MNSTKKKEQYKIKCSYCPEILERENNRTNQINACFQCKKDRQQKRYWDMLKLREEIKLARSVVK